MEFEVNGLSKKVNAVQKEIGTKKKVGDDPTEDGLLTDENSRRNNQQMSL